MQFTFHQSPKTLANIYIYIYWLDKTQSFVIFELFFRNIEMFRGKKSTVEVYFKCTYYLKTRNKYVINSNVF